MAHTDTEKIKILLEDYFDAIDSQKTDTPLDLRHPIAALEDLVKQPLDSLPADLNHYLKARSYRKAYAFLGGRRD